MFSNYTFLIKKGNEIYSNTNITYSLYIDKIDIFITTKGVYSFL